MVSLSNQITSFAQREDDSLYKAWENFKDLLRLYPHHNIQQWIVVQTFYDGITYAMRSMIDAAANGTLMSKTEEEAYNLIERMTLTITNDPTKEVNPRGLGVSLISML